jgi:anti-sigma factor RsiW
MTFEPDTLERLLSRYLDGESTPDEQRLLKSQLRQDPEARALFEETRNLDRQIGDALRLATGRHAGPRVIRATWARVGRNLAIAVAASLAALVWLQPRLPGAPPDRNRPQQASAASWFAPAPPAGDTVEPLPSGYVRPEVRLQGTQRDWIVIPGDRPGTYLVIEVDHVRTHVIGVHRDF